MEAPHLIPHSIIKIQSKGLYQMKRLRATLFNRQRVMKFLNEVFFDLDEDELNEHQNHKAKGKN